MSNHRLVNFISQSTTTIELWVLIMDRHEHKNRSNISSPPIIIESFERLDGKRIVSPGTIITVARSFHSRTARGSLGGEDSFHGIARDLP